MLRRNVLVLLSALLALTAVGTGPVSAAPTTLTVSTNLVGDPVTVLQKLADKFTAANPDIKVDFSAPGADYEILPSTRTRPAYLGGFISGLQQLNTVETQTFAGYYRSIYVEDNCRVR